MKLISIVILISPTANISKFYFLTGEFVTKNDKKLWKETLINFKHIFLIILKYSTENRILNMKQ